MGKTAGAELGKAGDEPKDIGVITCLVSNCAYEGAAIRKNKRGKLYVHCYRCGPMMNMDRKDKQDYLLQNGQYFKQTPKPAQSTQTPAAGGDSTTEQKHSLTGGFLQGFFYED